MRYAALLLLLAACDDVAGDGGNGVDAAAMDSSMDVAARPDAGVGTDAGSDAPLPDAALSDASDGRDATVDASTVDPREGPGLFVAVGYSLRRVLSRDGVEWFDDIHNGDDDTSKGNLLRDVVASDAGLLAIGTGRAFYTTDGAAWIESAPDGGFMGGVAYGAGFFVGAGGNGGTVRSQDGLTWEESVRVSPRDLHFRGIGFGDGLFVAVGDGGRRAVSVDGTNWDLTSEGGAGLQYVVWGHDRFVAVGHGGRRVSTTDGDVWADDVSDGGESLRDVVFARERFYAIGTGQIFISNPEDPSEWTKHDLSHSFVNIAYGNGRFVAVAGPRRFVSDDGIEWEETAGDGPGLWSVAFLPGI